MSLISSQAELASGVEVVPAALDALYLPHQQRVILLVLQRIDVRGIDDEQGRRAVVMEETRIGVRDIHQVFMLDEPLVADAAVRDTPHSTSTGACR